MENLVVIDQAPEYLEQPSFQKIGMTKIFWTV